MRKYRIIKETNLDTAEEMYYVEKRKYLFFWEKVKEIYSPNLEIIYHRFLLLTHPTKPKFKREEVEIDNIYVKRKDIEAKFIREEVDEEFERRKEKAKISENEIIERRIYKRLHLKYGKE